MRTYGCRSARIVLALRASAMAGCALAAMLPLPATAQNVQEETAVRAAPAEIREVRVGDSVSSSLDPANPFEEYRLRLAGGDSVQIDMESPTGRRVAARPPGDEPAVTTQLDSFLELRRLGAQDPVAVDDDGGDTGLNSRLIFTAPSSGEYIIKARGFGRRNEGAYTLRVTGLPRAPAPTDLVGDRGGGSLGSTSPVMVIYGESQRYALYWVNGEQGERMRIHVQSDAPSQSLELLSSSGSTLAASRNADPDIQIISVLPESGRYLVRVAIPSRYQARYSLDVGRAAMGTTRERTNRVLVGHHADAETLTLESNISPRPDGSGEADFFYKLYSLEVRANRPVTVIVDAPGFDPIVEAGEVDTLGFLPWVSVNSVAGRPARLVLRPFRTGTIYIRVRSPSLAIGSFGLRIVEGVAQPPT